MKGTGFTVVESFKDKRYDGLDFEIHYNPIHDSEGKLIGVSHFAINVHQRIQNEKKLEESKVELENVVKSLEIQNKELELLKELMSFLQSSLSMDDAIEIIKNYSKRILSGTSGIVYLISSDNLNLISRVLSWGNRFLIYSFLHLRIASLYYDINLIILLIQRKVFCVTILKMVKKTYKLCLFTFICSK